MSKKICKWCKDELPEEPHKAFWHYYGHFNEEYYFKKWSKAQEKKK